MKILYVANHFNQILDDTEGHITYGLRKFGHEVIEVLEKEYEKARDIKADLFLFHHWDIPERLEFIKNHPAKKKAFWYFDKIWGTVADNQEIRNKTVQENLTVADYAFMNDWTYCMKFPNPKFRELRQGIGDRLWDRGLGNPIQGLSVDIGFTGSLYGNRAEWADKLKERYGNRFRAFNGFYNRDLFNLCASCKIMLCPQFPIDDYYWGNRVYLMTGSGGFVIHAYAKRLAEEFQEKKDIVYYVNLEDMFEKIDYYLTHDDEREKIRLAGFQRAKELSFTYRVGQLLNYLK